MRALVAILALVAPAAAEPKPSNGIAHIAINYTYTSFHQNALSYSIQWKDGAYRIGQRAIDRAAVDALFAALTDLKSSDRELRCISHTDDYPEYHVTLGTDAWTPTIELGSSSNCHANVPWNIQRDGKRYVQYSGAAGRALRALLVAIDPGNWKRGPDSPEASTSGPGAEEVIALDDYKQGGAQTSAAGACARDLETSAQAKQFFGASPRVKELTLYCDLAKSADCSATAVRADFMWSGLTASVELPCMNAKVAFTKELEQVRDFVASKPVRTAVKLAGATGVRLWPAWGTWQLEGGSERVPRMEFTPGTAAIGARSVGTRGPTALAFWKELGLDVRKLSHKDHGWTETTAKLDFAGKLVR